MLIKKRRETLRMKKRIFLIAAFVMLLFGAAAFAYFYGYKGYSSSIFTNADAGESSPVETLIVITDAPSAAPSAQPTFTPKPTNAPIGDHLILVNRSHPMFDEPALTNISELQTAKNAVCDSRRHADETAIRALDEMLNAAAEEDGQLMFLISSAFRSYEEQEALWERKLADDPFYGQGGEPLKLLPPGCSEHITGLAFDILSPAHPHSDEAFAETPEGMWLRENAWRFGFILRYPKDKESVTGVVYEPWHFRFVGREAAEYMFVHGLCLEEFLEDTAAQTLCFVYIVPEWI